MVLLAPYRETSPPPPASLPRSVIRAGLLDTANRLAQNSFNVRTLVGNGAASYTDGVGQAISFNFPSGIAVTANKTLIITDSYNNALVRGSGV